MIAKDVVKSLVILSSDCHCDAVDEVIKLASSGMAETKIYLMYVEDSDPALDIYLKKEDFDEKKQRAQEICELGSKKITDAGLQVEILQPYFGIVSEEIARIEKQLGLDIIIIAAPERSTYKRILSGAHFSEDVVRKDTTPTLVVKTHQTRKVIEHHRDAEKIWRGPSGIDRAALNKGY